MKKISLIIITFLMCVTNIKAITREELQDMVVSTALSYLHNNIYTDYDQKSMDELSPINLKSNGTTNNQSTFNWRNLNISPEELNRTNHFSIDCSSFSTIVMLNSIGYNFTNYHSLQADLGYYWYDTNKQIFDYSKIGASSLTNEQKKERMLNRILKYGRGYNTSFFTNLASLDLGNPSSGTEKRDTTNNKIGHYYYQFKSDSKSTRETIYNKYINYLEPGDIIVYVRFEGTGHAMIYVGDKLGKEGFIHSTGSDFIKKDDGTWQIGDDKYSVRFDTMHTLKSRILDSSIEHLAIVRPINEYCNGSTCTTPSTLDSNAKARKDLQWLKIEQYTTKTSPTINNLNASSSDVTISSSQYNSLNNGENITYVLQLTNNSNKGYCIGTKGGNKSTSSECKGGDLSWYTSTKGQTYNNLVITASLPENTTYVENSSNCSYDKNTKKITCKITSTNPLKAGNTQKFTYTVKPTSQTTITNSGYTIKTQKSNVLKLSKIVTKINPTNNKINAEQLRNSINKFKNYVSNRKITYGTSNRSKLNAPIPETGTLTYSAYDFVGRIYYDAYGINMTEFNGSNVKNAIFNKSTDVGAYGKKTEKQISALTNENYKKINKMLVKGFYGGRYLKGNDNNDRPGRLRVTDLEVGDIIVYYVTSNGTIAGDSVPYVYLGTDSNNNLSFIRFKKGNEFIVKTTTNFFYEFWTKDLFLVLRPSQLYGTTVKYSGGTISGKNSSVEYNTYKTLKDLTSTKTFTLTLKYNKTGYTCDNCKETYTGANTFDGWYSDSKYTNKITNGTKLVSNGTHTIYSKWKKDKITLPNANIKGYSIEGWYSNSGLTIKEASPNTSYELKETKTLYAKWKPNTYTVRFNANGGTGTMSDQTHTYDSTKELTLNKFTKSGYVFSGWSTTKSGEVKYNDGEGVTNLSSKNNDTITLYAIWRVKENDEFEIILNLKNATSDATKKLVKKGASTSFTITPNKGYTNCKTNSSTYKLVDNKINISNVKENINITITCSGVQYTIIYNSNGGNGTMENSTHVYGTAKELNPNKYERTGYTFRGWSNEINGTIKYKDKENVVSLTTSKNFNLYAVWTPITYKITYELNGGILNESVSSYKITSNDVKLPTPTKEGYLFKGWTSSDIKTPQKEVIIKKGSTGNKIFTANYETGKYKISYKSDKYGTITGINEETLNYKTSPSGTTKTIKEGYKNLKWSVNKDVLLKDNTTILAGAPITESQIKQIIVKEDLVITAYHYIKKYQITYSNGKEGNISGITKEEVSYNSNPLGTKTNPNKGYKFKYWTANKNVKLTDGKTISKGKQISNIKSIVVTENLTLTPVFEKGTFKITYQSDDYGMITGKETENVTYPNTISLTETTALDTNFEFKYWIANTDVLLNNDTEIKKGNPITNEEVSKIIATNDMILTANYSQSLFNVYYLNHKDIVVTENPKEVLGKSDVLVGPKLDRTKWDKTVVFTSDKDVKLTSGKTIKAGKAITEEQLKQIIIEEDLNITPRYENELKFIDFDSINMDLLFTIIFVLIAIPVGIYIIKTIKRNSELGI